MEADLVRREGIPYTAVAGGGLRGLSVWEAGRNALRLVAGTARAYGILRGFRPDIVFATGGFVCVPVVVAARLQRRPILIYLPDIEPGLAVRFLAPLADRIAVTAEDSRAFLPAAKVVVTGYPVRSGLGSRDKHEARRRLALDPDLKTLLVLGGSQGAHAINKAISDALEILLEHCQVLHICGPWDEAWLRQVWNQLSTCNTTRYSVYSYLHHEMLDALAAADLVVARAGAATLGEFPAVGLPSILVPYPYSGGHQRPNARYLAEHGAALVVENGEIGSGALGRIVVELLSDEERLARMGQRARRLARPDATERIVAELRQLAHGGGHSPADDS